MTAEEELSDDEEDEGAEEGERHMEEAQDDSIHAFVGHTSECYSGGGRQNTLRGPPWALSGTSIPCRKLVTAPCCLPQRHIHTAACQHAASVSAPGCQHCGFPSPHTFGVATST